MKQRLLFSLLSFSPLLASAIQVNGVVVDPTCGLANGGITASVTGGQAPYTWVWSPAPPTGQGTNQIGGLTPGTWSVTVTDALAQQATHDFTLSNLQWITNVEQAITWVYDGSAAHHPCPGFQNGSITLITSMLNGTPPYTAEMNGQPPIGYDINSNEPYFGYFSATDQIYLNVTDATGCAGAGQVIIDSPPLVGVIASNIDPACGGLANGSAEINVGYAGPYGPEVLVNGPNGNVYFDFPTYDPLYLNGLEAGSYLVLRTYATQYFPDPGCQFSDNFMIPDLGADCGSVSGRLYIDNNQNCVQNGGEPSVPYRVIEINPGPEYAITNGSGDYTRNLINGNFSLEPQGTGTDLYPICPAVQPAPFTVNYDNVILNLADSSLLPLDLQLTAHGSVARPGFAHTIWGNVRNLSAHISGAVTFTVTFDPQMNYVGASPTPTSVAGNVLTWDLPALIAFSRYDFIVHLMVPPDPGLIGLPFAHSLSASQPLAESTLVNNGEGLTGFFQGSYDPNDKVVHTSSGSSATQYFIGTDEYLDYTIRFQNTGTDTAFTVVVTDTLSEELDMPSFQQGVASHPFDVSFKPGRVVEWRFESILLPDSGTNESASHGLVNFRVRPMAPVLPGTLFVNNADIFFDFNPPIRTHDAIVVAEMSTGIAGGGEDALVVFPVPTQDRLFVLDPKGATTYSEARILSLDGREVLRCPATGSMSGFPVGVLPAGTYLVELRSSDGQSRWAHFVKE
ncbi:MAG: hypothetical protein ABI432_10130 [Flavobacteriales bacterium]